MSSYDEAMSAASSVAGSRRSHGGGDDRLPPAESGDMTSGQARAWPAYDDRRDAARAPPRGSGRHSRSRSPSDDRGRRDRDGDRDRDRTHRHHHRESGRPDRSYGRDRDRDRDRDGYHASRDRHGGRGLSDRPASGAASPSPSDPPARRSRLWDQPPPEMAPPPSGGFGPPPMTAGAPYGRAGGGGGGGGGIHMATGPPAGPGLMGSSDRGASSAMPPPGIPVQTLLTLEQKEAQLRRAHSERQRRRLYVGNLPLNITADDLLRFMNQTLLSLNRLQPDEFGHPVTRPALETTVNRDRSFTFVQMATMDAANLMMALDGIPFNGANLKVRRPKEYVPPPEGEPVIHLDVSHLTGFVSNNVPDGPDKVFIGGLPPDLSEQLVMDLLTAFGPLRAFNLVKDPAAGPGVNKGFAFCMYANPQVTDVACSNLNNMEVGDRRIVVQRASVGSSTGGRRDPMRDAMGPYAGLYDAIAPLLRDHAEVDPATGALRPQRHPTDPVIVLYNLLSPEEMRDPAELKEAQEDVRLEAERLGPVVRIAWVSQHQPVPAAGAYGSPSAPAAATAHSLASTSTGHHVRVYIEYASMDAAQQALASLAGRTFNHRVVLGADATRAELEAAVAEQTAARELHRAAHAGGRGPDPSTGRGGLPAATTTEADAAALPLPPAPTASRELVGGA